MVGLLHLGSFVLGLITWTLSVVNLIRSKKRMTIRIGPGFPFLKSTYR